MRTVFALIDCNNFFVSCEKLFRPDLEGKPVVVLSSNDGCVVARSQEAKDLAIPMGAPAFKYRETFSRNKVTQFSANFELYGDISRRIVQLLTTITPRIEIYSVDESFLDLSGLGIGDYTQWGRAVRTRILQYTGIPVSVGIAPTKTLAKLASDRAKKLPGLKGALCLTAPADTEPHLRALPVQDVWGVGRRLAPVLKVYGLMTAYDLARITPAYGRQLLGGVRGEQLVRELNGMSCLPLAREGAARKSIARTRTFGEDTYELPVLEAAIASFAAQAALRLRHEKRLTRRAGLFLTTSRHKPGYRSWSRELRLPAPTADSGPLIRLLVEGLEELYEPGAAYHRAGVWLCDFVPDDVLQTDVWGRADVPRHKRAAARMRAMDSVNARFGKRCLHYAAEDLGSAWAPICRLRSPRYTSNWNELAPARIHFRA